MLKLLVLTLTLGVANVGLYADCDKCCGNHVLEAVAHRDCDDEGGGGNCHVSECDATFGPSGCCWSIFGNYNDLCTPYDAGDAGYHSCGL